MVETYDSRHPGTVKVFFVVSEDVVTSIIIGNQTVSTGRGYQFYIEDHVAEQIDKCELVIDGLTPKLVVKEGEVIYEPEKTEKELEIERLKHELEQLENAD